MTAMYAYTTVKSATVMPPKPSPANAPRFAALREVMAARDCTVIDAMIHLERKDKHRALLPSSGGRGLKMIGAESGTRTAILAVISDEWQDYTAFVGVSLGASKANTMSTLSLLCVNGEIERRATGGKIRTQYRRLQATP
jgi:hypothetical protein